MTAAVKVIKSERRERFDVYIPRLDTRII